jgi:hypothetical protein
MHVHYLTMCMLCRSYVGNFHVRTYTRSKCAIWTIKISFYLLFNR